MSLQALMEAIHYRANPIQLFQNYRGQEWKKYIQYKDHIIYSQSQILYKTTSQKLIITGWKPYQYQEFVENNATIHTLVLEGNLYSRLERPGSLLERRMLIPHSYLSSSPHSQWNLLCMQQCASLHLIQAHPIVHEDDRND